jgi:hypothetical protein
LLYHKTSDLTVLLGPFVLCLGAFRVSYPAGSFGIREFISRTKGVTQAHHATAARALSQIGKKVKARIQATQKPANRFMAVRCRTSTGIAPEASRKKAGNKPTVSQQHHYEQRPWDFR